MKKTTKIVPATYVRLCKAMLEVIADRQAQKALFDKPVKAIGVARNKADQMYVNYVTGRCEVTIFQTARLKHMGADVQHLAGLHKGGYLIVLESTSARIKTPLGHKWFEKEYDAIKFFLKADTTKLTYSTTMATRMLKRYNEFQTATEPTKKPKLKRKPKAEAQEPKASVMRKDVAARPPKIILATKEVKKKAEGTPQEQLDALVAQREQQLTLAKQQYDNSVAAINTSFKTPIADAEKALERSKKAQARAEAKEQANQVKQELPVETPKANKRPKLKRKPKPAADIVIDVTATETKPEVKVETPAVAPASEPEAPAENSKDGFVYQTSGRRAAVTSKPYVSFDALKRAIKKNLKSLASKAIVYHVVNGKRTEYALFDNHDPVTGEELAQFRWFTVDGVK